MELIHCMSDLLKCTSGMVWNLFLNIYIWREGRLWDPSVFLLSCVCVYFYLDANDKILWENRLKWVTRIGSEKLMENPASLDHFLVLLMAISSWKRQKKKNYRLKLPDNFLYIIIIDNSLKNKHICFRASIPEWYLTAGCTVSQSKVNWKKTNSTQLLTGQHLSRVQCLQYLQYFIFLKSFTYWSSKRTFHLPSFIMPVYKHTMYIVYVTVVEEVSGHLRMRKIKPMITCFLHCKTWK